MRELARSEEVSSRLAEESAYLSSEMKAND